MSRFKRLLTTAALLFIGAVGSAQAQEKAACGPGQVIKFAEIGWDSGKFFTEIIREIVEKGYGCKTDIVVGTNPITQSALISNDLQVFVEYWSGRTESFEKAAAAGKIKIIGELVDGGGQEGWYVPEYVVKGDSSRGIKPLAPNLKSVSDLPKYASLFKDDEEPTKGRFFNCPTGWSCQKDNEQRMKAYKLTGMYNSFKPGTGAAFDAAIASAFQRGQPILFTYWSPSSILGKYKVVRLSEPAFSEKCWNTINGSTTDIPCGSSSPSTNLAVAVSKPFSDSSPELVQVISKVTLPMEAVNKAIAEMGDKKVPARTMAKAYLDANPGVVKKWLSAAAYKKLYSTQ